MTLAQHNLGLYADNHRRERDRLSRVLDTVRERFDVRCGPLEPHSQAVR